jgi:alpha-N-arabinofuranosidase
MMAKPEETNTINEPEKIVPIETKITGLAPRFEHTFPGYSITVLEIPTRNK